MGGLFNTALTVIVSAVLVIGLFLAIVVFIASAIDVSDDE